MKRLLAFLFLRAVAVTECGVGKGVCTSPVNKPGQLLLQTVGSLGRIKFPLPDKSGGCDGVYRGKNLQLVDSQNRHNNYIEWTLPVCEAGPHLLAFAYARGGRSRPLRLVVNGVTSAGSLAFGSTASRQTWRDVKAEVSLVAGHNTVRLQLQATGSSGANFDKLTVARVVPPEPVAALPAAPLGVAEEMLKDQFLPSASRLDEDARAGAGFGNITVSPSVVSTSGGQVLVTLQHRVSQARKLHCKLQKAPTSTNSWDMGHRSCTCEVPRAGDRTVHCELPALLVEGPVLLRLGPSVLVQSSALVRYVARISASFGQTPYFAKAGGELLVRTNTEEEGALRVLVISPRGQTLLSAPVQPKAHATFNISFGELSVSFVGHVKVKLLGSGGVVLGQTQVRLVRVPTRRRGSAAVDHKRRGLLVDGRPFFSIGWFDTYLFYGVEATIESLGAIAQRGANSAMIYNLVGSSRPPTFPDRGSDPLPLNSTLVVLDAAAALGIRVHVYLVDIVKPLADGTSTDWEALLAIVRVLMEHPAVLAWYVADDGAGSSLPVVYRAIKKLDPYHLISASLAHGYQLYEPRYLRGADVIMMEAYQPSAEAPFHAMKAYDTWPTEFFPAITCGRAWTRQEDFGVISRKVLRSQVYHALIGGATGEMWFAYRNAKGWNEPGIPLEDAASEVTGELLDLVPALLSSGPYDAALPLEPVKVFARPIDGGVDNTTAVKAKAFREESGCVTLLLANSLSEPVQATVQFPHGTPGVFDVRTWFAEATAPYEGDETPRRVAVRHGTLVDLLPSLGTQVFRLSGTGDCAAAGWAPSQDDHPPGGNFVQNPSFELSRAYASSPDNWDCNSSPLLSGATASSCFTDSSIQKYGRRSGRFITGRHPELLRIRPGIIIQHAFRLPFQGSIWAQADTDMELLVMRAVWDPVWMPFEKVAHNETVAARMNLTDEWQQLRFSVSLDQSDQLYFKVTRPGVLWLDGVDLRPTAGTIPNPTAGTI